MSTVLSGVWAFIKLLPALYNIYKSLQAAYGEVELNVFIDKLSTLTTKSIAIRESNLSFEEKRKARRELLAESAAVWSSSINA